MNVFVQAEMLDLPLSELQASIESEFEGGDCEY